ncbi:hypothetical protein OCAR_4444 [Afipia carboxidovorans OM5]|nr:hypothetical protein OCAR_4444 [Afipia carboxidovorans OM5]
MLKEAAILKDFPVARKAAGGSLGRKGCPPRQSGHGVRADASSM